MKQSLYEWCKYQFKTNALRVAGVECKGNARAMTKERYDKFASIHFWNSRRYERFNYIASGRKCSTSKLVSSKMPHSKRQALAEITNCPRKQNIKKKNDDISSIVIASNFNDNVL